MSAPILASRPTRPLVCEATPEPLWITCEHCEDGTRWTSRYGGNDPDVWRAGPCDVCDGTGRRVLCCDGCPDPEAVEWFQDYKWCARCAAEQKADALEKHPSHREIPRWKSGPQQAPDPDTNQTEFKQ